jgi:large subunit ribosomal protein L10e
MGMRKAYAYSKKHVVPYTRISKKRQKAYIKAVPPSKIVKFRMGKEKDVEAGKLPHKLTLVTIENVQIRQNALEACRQYINKKLDKELSGQYFFRVVPFTHHIQRENKMLTGAGADRMQTGMQLSFGKTIAKAAIMKKGAPIFEISVPTPKAIQFVRKTYGEIKSKLPCKTTSVYTLNNEVKK